MGRLGRPAPRFAGRLIRQARELRRAGRFLEAAIFYGEACRLRPGQAEMHIQCGHMFKEAGLLDRAKAQYHHALQLNPADAALYVQLGHLHKVAGRLAEAEAAYREALRLAPVNEDAVREIAHLQASGWRLTEPIGLESVSGTAEPMPGAQDIARLARLAPRLAPRAADLDAPPQDERVEVPRLGRYEIGYWGRRRTLRGVEAIRGFCVSATPIVEVQIIFHGLTIHRGEVRGGYRLPSVPADVPLRKYVFNIWLDFGRFAEGFHTLEVRLIAADGTSRSFHDQVVVAAPAAEADYPGSDALVAIDPQDDRGVEEQVRSRPSMTRAAARDLFPHGVRNVLVMRTDQLGDMVASISAVLRLRELLPDARLVGLVTDANADLAMSLALFDEVIEIDFPDDPIERRRLMPLDAQEALRRRLQPYRFDIALDLAQSNVSRDLLALAGARFTYGMSGSDWPGLSLEYALRSHDPWNDLDVVPHSAKMLGMVETLGALLRLRAPVIRRSDLPRDLLGQYGIAPDDRFILLHCGARVALSRWPHFARLAELLLAATDLKIVMMADDPSMTASLSDDTIASPRFILFDRRVAFDLFDAFVSYCTVLVGNDSGPKHLAALRGTNVVTIFTARINWSEWGQEGIGTIISRRVPCAGCLIFHDGEECGKDFACVVDIRPDEVFEAVIAHV